MFYVKFSKAEQKQTFVRFVPALGQLPCYAYTNKTKGNVDMDDKTEKALNLFCNLKEEQQQQVIDYLLSMIQEDSTPNLSYPPAEHPKE